MSFREKSAWITFLTVLAAAVFYVSVRVIGRVEGIAALHLLLGCVIGVIALQAALHALAAALSRPGERGPKDERERAIQLRSHSVGYYVLMLGVIAMFFTGHVRLSAFDLLWHALAALTLSTLAISLTQIVLFRLGR